MATYAFMEIHVPRKELEQYPYNDTDIVYTRHKYANWSYVKAAARKYLTKDQFQVIVLMYQHGWTQERIAVVQGISQQAVSGKHRRAIIKLKKILNK